MTKFFRRKTAISKLSLEEDIWEHKAKLDAIDKNQAVIEFSMDGIVIDVNRNFLATFGYERSEIVGRHHQVLMDPKESASADYEEFWRKLRDGHFMPADFAVSTGMVA